MMDSPEEEVKSPPCPWRVEETDEARYNFSDQKGIWQPKAEDILSVFEKLTQGGALPLKWQCPGRRPPESDVPLEKETEMETEMAEDQLKEDLNDPEPSAFDFDDSLPETNTKVTPWRTHAGMARTPKTEKRVARMDNIMDSLRKQQIQRAAEREARKSKAGTPSRAQQGRGRLIKFGSPLSKKASPSPPIASLFGTSPPSESTDVGAGDVTTSSSSSPLTTVSSSTVAQSSANNAPPNGSKQVLAPKQLLAPSESGEADSKVQGQELKNDEEKESYGVPKNEGRDFRQEEVARATIAGIGSSSSSSSLSSTVASGSSHSSYDTITSEAQMQQATTTASSMSGLGLQNFDQKSDTAADQQTSKIESTTASSSNINTSSNPTTSPLVTTATHSSLSTNVSATQKPLLSLKADVSAPKSSSGPYPNFSTDISENEEKIKEPSPAIPVSTNQSGGQMASTVTSSSTETVSQSGAQNEGNKSASLPPTANPSQASAMSDQTALPTTT